MASWRSRHDTRGAPGSAGRRGVAVPRRARQAVSRSRSGEPAIRLFGPPAVRVAGGWEPLRPGKSSALVAYVVHRTSPVRRSELAALLWPELDEQRAHTNLRQLLKGLANGVLCDCIERDRDSVRSAVVSDVVAFERALDDARWSDAVELYQGPLLDGFDDLEAGEFASWVANERAVAEGRWRHACLALLEADGGEAWAAHALKLTERMLRVDPLDEVALRHAMRAAAAVGDTVTVRQRFDAFRAALGAEVGVDPEPSTIALAEQLSAIASSGLGTRFGAGQPRPATLAVAGTRPPLPRSPGRRRVIGRSTAVRQLAGLVEREDVRVVTLLAPGGMGKTTLAIALAEALEPGFPDGVAFAALEDVESDALVPALANALGLVLSPGAPALDQLIATLAPKTTLLVLDAFERHQDQVGVLDALVRGCPRLTLIATTRSRLRLSTEVVFEVPPLDTEDRDTVGDVDVDDPTPSAAARLFLRVTARNGVRLPPAADDLARIERICRLVGGSPLAIELVAAWTDVLSLREVERQVESSWDLLRSDDVDRGDRHGDVEATLAATWEHLADEDRAAWARLAVLPGSLDRTLAATVAGTGWRGLRRLVDGALLARNGDRLEMHALVARFGRERAADGGWEEAAWDAAVGVWLERVSLTPRPAPRSRAAWHQHDLDQAAAAWRWTIERGRVDDAAALAVALLRALGRAGRHGDQTGAAADAVRALEARAHGGRERDLVLARVLPFVGGTEAATASARGLALAEALGDDVALGASLAGLLRAEPTVAAAARFARAREAYERAEDDVGMLDLLLVRADLLIACGRLDEGETLVREVAALGERLGDGLALAHACDLEAATLLLRGDLDEARERLATARARFEAEGGAYRGSGTLANEAWLAVVAGDRAEAERRVEAFVASERRYRDARVVAAALHSGLYARFDEHDGVVVEARTVLERLGSEGQPSVLRFFAHQRLARALAGLGEPAQAAQHLRHALGMARAFDAPRFVARLALSAGAVAVASGRLEDATTLLAHAAHHPRIDASLLDDLRALAAEAGTDVDASAPCDDDAALLERVERLLATLEAAS